MNCADVMLLLMFGRYLGDKAYYCEILLITITKNLIRFGAYTKVFSEFRSMDISLS